MSSVKNLFQLSKPQEIIFCFGTSDKHKADASVIQQLLHRAFSEQNYRYFSLQADRFSLDEDKLKKSHKLFSSTPPVFIIDDPQFQQIDECQSWLLLQQKCRAIALIYVLPADSFFYIEADHIKKLWNNFHRSNNSEDPDKWRIIFVKKNQEALTPEQIQDLKYVINCRTKKPSSLPLQTGRWNLSPEFSKLMIWIVISVVAMMAIGKVWVFIYDRIR